MKNPLAIHSKGKIFLDGTRAEQYTFLHFS